MIAMRDLGTDHAKVNVNGGACALGHPIGASGARIMVTLINALKTRGLKRGVASLCIGDGGEATAMAVRNCCDCSRPKGSEEYAHKAQMTGMLGVYLTAVRTD